MAAPKLRHALPNAPRNLTGFLEPARGALAAPLSAELLGPALQQTHGAALARLHVSERGRSDDGAALIARLRRNAHVIRECAAVLEDQQAPGVYVSPAAQWLGDNMSLLDEQLDAVTEALPARYFRHLPVLRSGPAAGTPRVYDIAWAWLPRAGHNFDPELLDAFIDGYQSEREPTWGEWWALSPVLRMVLIEHLRRVGERVAAEKTARALAHWIASSDTLPAASQLDRALKALSARGVAQAFLLQLHASWQDRPEDEAGRQWLVRHLDNPVATLHDQQAADAAQDVDVAHAVRSLRAVSQFDWRSWIESRSRLSIQLRALPAFADEDDSTQNSTLHSIERWSRQRHLDEVQIAQALVEQVRAAAADQAASGVSSTPGHWLDGDGRAELAAALGVSSASVALGPDRWPRARLPLYILAVVLATLAVLPKPLLPGGDLLAFAITLLLAWPASEVAVSTLNRLLCEWLPPRRLPRIAFERGVPAEHRVLLVVPCLLGSDASIATLAAQIERHHLASNETWAQYGLLSDYADAPTEKMPGDARQLAQARQALRALNARYAPLPDGSPRFLLLHRQRVWSATEQRWMGWERKRGKIEQLVDLIAGAAEPGAFVELPQLSAPSTGTPYLVVLDSDTLLPPGTLRALVGIAAHPANQPRFDREHKRVVEGWGVLQPRVALPLPTPGTATPYHTWSAGQQGLDPYSGAASEVYQDLFAEGSFTGKGLIHVQAARQVLSGRLPEGQVLSHDLLEGALLRCAAVNDVPLLEGAPVHPDVASSRLHRWTRGDWQLLPFIARPRHWGITALNLWKMLDNLRRSLVPPVCVALLMVSAATGRPAMNVALTMVLAALAAGPLVGAMAAFASSDDRVSLLRLGRFGAGVLWRALAGAAWQLAMLLQQSVLLLDAIGRALIRQFITRRGLLAWTTAAAAEAAASREWKPLWKRHRRVTLIALVLALGLVALHVYTSAPLSVVGLVLCALWAATPLLVMAASRPLAPPRQRAPTREMRADLHDLARETWRYFEQVVSADHHFLPPDNHQRVPQAWTAPRTSPTNIGLYLLATLCVRRLGFIGRREAAQRIADTLGTLEVLPRHRGHFFNWYDTRNLAVLAPAYISTVDSGNLSGCLIAAAGALREMAAGIGEPTFDAATLEALERSAEHLSEATERGLLRGIDADESALALVAVPPRDPAQAAALAEAAEAALRDMRHHLSAFDDEHTLDGTPPDAAESALWRFADHLAMLRSAARDIAQPPDTTTAAALRALAQRAETLAWEAEYGWLHDRQRDLLHIGALHDGERVDANHYDLLASEARLASLLAIAKGDVPMHHWGRLRRATFAQGADVGLQSWSGSMFEYLMPMLLVDEPQGSLLHAACVASVREQHALGELWDLPWGVSESAHAERDPSLAYQYGPQGVPTLALRRTPPSERVIAPYATLLAAQVDPVSAWHNLQRLAQRGARDRMGFIEALDYTPARQVDGTPLRRVATFMAHHQGMAIVALANVLCEGVARRWFMGHARIQAVSPLLHEPLPGAVRPLRALPLVDESVLDGEEPGPMALHARHLVPGTRALQPTALLSNGRYAVMLQADGAGASRWNGIAVNRWRDDALRGLHGQFFFLHVHGQSGTRWHSLTQHPAPDPQADYACEWQPHAALYRARWPGLATQMRIWVAPEEDVELRELTLEHRGAGKAPTIDLASYFEVALAPQAADEAHPAFANLFVQVRWDAHRQALWLQRRGRLEGEPVTHAVHFLAEAQGDTGGLLQLSATTDRAHAIGRGRSVQTWHPRAQEDSAQTGLDPIASICVKAPLPEHGPLVLRFATAVSHDEGALALLIDRHRQKSHAERSWRMSATLAAIALREAGVGAVAWRAWQTLSTPMAGLLSRPLGTALGTDEAAAPIDRRALWRFGLSGERPLLVVRVPGVDGLPLAEWVARMTPLWAWGGMAVDVVLLNTEPPSYLQPVLHGLTKLVESRGDAAARPPQSACKLITLRADELSALELLTLRRLARVDLLADGRPLEVVLVDLRRWHAQALERRQASLLVEPAWLTPAAVEHAAAAPLFDRDSGACRFAVGPATRPQRPWTNVLANPVFGTQVTEAGGGHTWAHNSRQLQLTPWFNDPLCDPAGEWLLLQDLDTRVVWNAWPAPWGAAPVAYRVEHGPGWSRAEHVHDGLSVTVEVCVDEHTAVKQTTLRLRSHGRARRVRVVALAQWQMGANRSDRASVHTRLQAFDASPARDDTASQTALALHATQTDAGGGFGQATAFLALRPSQPQARWAFDWTCDRREFFDARGAAVLPDDFGECEGSGLDPCAALSVQLDLAAGSTQGVAVLLGHADAPHGALRAAIEAVAVDPQQRLDQARRAWRERLDPLQVRTPDPQFDVLVNHWLRYQALACRIWARAGYYQAGGAFGFRDQLQDAMALTDSSGAPLREQILRCCSRQFAAGDVQHWWHPPQGAGVRTRFSDDLLWLAAAVLRHIDTGGDAALLDEQVPFLEGSEVPAGAEDVYETPRESSERASVYEHAARALDKSLAFGAHGLPLMGAGDWNDGMNRVGIEGRGESIWLAWFQLTLLGPMAALAQQRGEPERAAGWHAAAQALRSAVDNGGWDGAWYRRAFFDDGSPLGSSANDECKIDLIAQAWSVLASGTDPSRARQAMRSAAQHLLDREHGVLRLLAPPLQHQQPSAGYIQAYPPGVRENGGQYSHAATWASMAFARIGDAALAWEAWKCVSPAHRSADPQRALAYGIEPYAVAGDVYGEAPYRGRGGWSWYTGAAGWLHRAGVESLLGLQRRAGRVRFAPVLPPDWPGARVTLRWQGRTHHFVLGALLDSELAALPAQTLPIGQWIQLESLPDGSVCTVPLASTPASPAPTEDAARAALQRSL